MGCLLDRYGQNSFCPCTGHSIINLLLCHTNGKISFVDAKQIAPSEKTVDVAFAMQDNGFRAWRIFFSVRHQRAARLRFFGRGYLMSACSRFFTRAMKSSTLKTGVSNVTPPTRILPAVFSSAAKSAEWMSEPLVSMNPYSAA